MNRYLYLVFFFIIASFSTVIGQQLSVKSFRALPNDMDARQNYKTMDQNGELCAIPGYVVAFEKVNITEGATSSINATLQNGREVMISSAPVGIDLNFKSFKEIVNGVSFDMVAIQGGLFMMGSNDGYENEKPIHRVTITDFYMGKTEVTQALWKAVMGTNPSCFKGDNLPVHDVSWNDVQVFIVELNRLTGKKYRLPTEAEWEYAAGGGSKNRTKWAGTDVESSMPNYIWYGPNSGRQTHEVATKFPNSLGLYDMCGNVWEWCDDWYGSYSSSDQVNPAGASSGLYRVFRGGSWSSGLSDCRVANRIGYKPGHLGGILGFRLSLVP